MKSISFLLLKYMYMSCVYYEMKWVLEVSRQTKIYIPSYIMYSEFFSFFFSSEMKIMNEFFDCGSYRDRNISLIYVRKKSSKKYINKKCSHERQNTGIRTFTLRVSDIIIEHLLNLQRKWQEIKVLVFLFFF